MWIKNLRLNKFRNYFYENIEFNKDINIFLGNNAQGKTNLLESVYYLSNAKSFKSVKDKDIVMFGQKTMQVEGRIRKEKRFKDVKIIVDEEDKDIYINDIKYDKSKDLQNQFKLVLFTPEDLNIIKDGPNFRRELFDDIIISVDFSYKNLKKNFNKILFQRNKLLKMQKSKYFNEQLKAYDEQIIASGYKIYLYRKKYVNLIEKFAKNYHYRLTDYKEELTISYAADIRAESFDQYKDEFLENRQNDLKYMTSSRGVNRDEIDIKINSKELKKFGSQGQQRSAILNIKLGQVKLIEESSRDKAIILFDDVFSELDENRSQFLLDNLGSFQTIISATNIKSLENVDKSKVRKISDGHIRA